MYEIERKFLIDPNKVPVSLYDPINTEAFYIQLDPEIKFKKEIERFSEERMYSKITKTKTKNYIDTEIEIISEDDYYDNFPRLTGKPITYKTYVVELDNEDQSWVFVVIHSNDLAIAEVYFETNDEAGEFVIPEWFGEEIAGIEEYEDVSLAMGGELK